MVKHLGSKTGYSNEKEYCVNCGHENIPHCTCNGCEESRKIILEKKRKIIANFYYEDKWDKIEEQDLSLKERLYLAVVLRCALSENMVVIKPLNDVRGELAPTEELESKIIDTLTNNKNILMPSLMSDISAFSLDDISLENSNDSIAYYTYKVHYRINVAPMDEDYNEMIKRFLYPDFLEEENYKEFCYETWKKVALAESLQYLLYRMKKVGYDFNPGEKTIQVFGKLLENFSVAQVYGIIYGCIARSTERYQSREITKLHAQNSVISACESYGERALANGWKLKSYSRERDLPETMISKVLFTSIMKIVYLGFSENPTIDF
jgi:hypothetical protein